ncbi:MAG: sulfurtransferase [Bacteroidota bacterium]|nr:sulfurtransferase [Bacteroidota bacterium]
MKKLIFSFITLLSLAMAGIAQDLISVADLSAKLKDPSFVVISAEVETEYAKVHITDAVNVPYTSLEKKVGAVEGLLISPEEIAKAMSAKGVSEKKTIVVYDEGTGKYAGRVYWILKYMGVPNVKILDGGLIAWKAARKPVTKNPTIVKPETFSTSVNNSIFASMKDVQAAVGNSKIALVDFHEAALFNGKDPKGKGRIPGSVNVDHTTLLDAKSVYKSKTDLQKMFNDVGATSDKTIYVICSSGTRASKGYFALKSILGYPNVKLYDGGLNEWAATPSNKMEK